MLFGRRAVGGRSGPPASLPPADAAGATGEVDRVLAAATAADPQQRYDTASAFAAALREALAMGAATQVSAPARNPYRGLRPFLEADAADFVGRDALVARLIERLSGDGAGARFVTLVGASGGGKSSVIRAGVVPAIRRGAV